MKDLKNVKIKIARYATKIQYYQVIKGFQQKADPRSADPLLTSGQGKFSFGGRVKVANCEL